MFAGLYNRNLEPIKTYQNLKLNMRKSHCGAFNNTPNNKKGFKKMLKPIPMPTEQGLLKNSEMVQQHLQPRPGVGQVTIEGMAADMLAAGYTPAHRTKAAADMQAVDWPQYAIIQAIEIADRSYAEREKMADQAAAAQAPTTNNSMMQRMSAPIRSIPQGEMS